MQRRKLRNKQSDYEVRTIDGRRDQELAEENGETESRGNTDTITHQHQPLQSRKHWRKD